MVIQAVCQRHACSHCSLPASSGLSGVVALENGTLRGIFPFDRDFVTAQ
jgi:hypothetical protein